MIEGPRFFTFQAELFDGVTVFEPSLLQPNTPLSRNQPRLYATVDGPLGRFNVAGLLRPGNLGAFVVFRAVTPPGVNDRVELRSAAADEQPGPQGGDWLLETLPIATTWSRPVLLGPTDALDVFHDPADRPAQIEMLVIEVQGDTISRWIAAQASSASGCCSVTSLVSAAALVEVPGWQGLQIVEASHAAADVQLPPLVQVPLGARLAVANTGTGVVTIDAGGALVNGLLTRQVLRQQTTWLVRGPSAWEAVDGRYLPAPLVTALNSAVSAWVDSPMIVQATGNNRSITLPDPAQLQPGAWGLMVSTGGLNFLSGGAGLLNGSGDSLPVPRGGAALFVRLSATEYLALVIPQQGIEWESATAVPIPNGAGPVVLVSKSIPFTFPGGAVEILFTGALSIGGANATVSTEYEIRVDGAAVPSSFRQFAAGVVGTFSAATHGVTGVLAPGAHVVSVVALNAVVGGGDTLQLAGNALVTIRKW